MPSGKHAQCMSSETGLKKLAPGPVEGPLSSVGGVNTQAPHTASSLQSYALGTWCCMAFTPDLLLHMSTRRLYVVQHVIDHQNEASK